MIILTHSLWFLNALVSFFVVVIFSYLFSSLKNPPNPTEDLLIMILTRTVYYSVNFLTIIGMLYLFLFQGVKNLREARKNANIDGLADVLISKDLIFKEST